MDKEETIEGVMAHSDFIEKYVKEHKRELEELRVEANSLGFDGEWFIIGDHGYRQKRLQYATTSFEESEMSPRIILYPKYPTGQVDIQKALGLCRKLKMAVAVRTGGHQYCGYSSTTPVNMQIDLSETFPEYNYDPDNNVLHCGVSHDLGSWAESNHNNGIYLPMGICAHVHLGGHVHTGGWGMVARSHGLLADHVLAFSIIFANGSMERIVRPENGTTAHNDDAFFAVLGGSKGGDFGIVTHWEFSPMRDDNYPNSACYTFVWLWSKGKMEGVQRHMLELSKLCVDGVIPSDYEFMLTITGRGDMDWLPQTVKVELEDLEQIIEGVPVPAMIQVWMCYTNKGGVGDEFDDQWFESFTADDVCGGPLHANRLKHTPVSEGLAQHFIMKQKREMEYPFVKRARVSMDVPDQFPETYTNRMYEIMGITGSCDGLHLVSQEQIYAGGAVAENGRAGITSYSWRKQEMAMGHDAFYSKGWIWGDYHQAAEKWQKENDEAFIGKQAFAEADMRVFAYTFGERELEEVWQHYYDSKDKYHRLRTIKGILDPDGLFIVDGFSLKPLS